MPRDKALGISVAVDEVLNELGGAVPIDASDDEIPF
jgi:hypothetical protein